jgi:hypothetical protein
LAIVAGQFSRLSPISWLLRHLQKNSGRKTRTLPKLRLTKIAPPDLQHSKRSEPNQLEKRSLVRRWMPKRRSVIQFLYPELPPSQRSWWLLVAPNTEVDLCSVDPGFDVDLHASTDLPTMTAIWMGLDNIRAAQGTQRMMLTGDRRLASDMQAWLGLSPFAKVCKLAS